MDISIIVEEIDINFKLGQDARRLFHGRGGCFEGFQNLAIDWIPPHILIECYEDYEEDLIDQIKIFLMDKYRDSVEGIFWRNRKKTFVYKTLYGELPDKHLLWEGDLCYEVNFKDNQNIGFFMDMRPGRELLQSICQGKSVLNLFSYTCSFSVVAIKHNALKVVNVDMKRNFLKQGMNNHLINNLSTKNVICMPHDIMKSFGGIRKKGPFDIIIIDPPSNQREHFNVERDYRKIFSHLSEWLSEKGEVIACLNSPFFHEDFLLDLKDQLYPGLMVKKILGPSLEFREKDPKKGLKIIFFSL